MYAIKNGFYQMFVYLVLYLVYVAISRKPIEKQKLLVSTIFVIVPIILETLKVLLR
jgi:hypothetical protein